MKMSVSATTIVLALATRHDHAHDELFQARGIVEMRSHTVLR
jgi:hypothetical protein